MDEMITNEEYIRKNITNNKLNYFNKILKSNGILIISTLNKNNKSLTVFDLCNISLFINFIDPDFISNTAALQADALREAQPTLDEDIIEMQQTNTEKFFYISYPVILILNVFLGLIVGLLTGLFTKKS